MRSRRETKELKNVLTSNRWKFIHARNRELLTKYSFPPHLFFFMITTECSSLLVLRKSKILRVRFESTVKPSITCLLLRRGIDPSCESRHLFQNLRWNEREKGFAVRWEDVIWKFLLTFNNDWHRDIISCHKFYSVSSWHDIFSISFSFTDAAFSSSSPSSSSSGWSTRSSRQRVWK